MYIPHFSHLLLILKILTERSKLKKNLIHHLFFIHYLQGVTGLKQNLKNLKKDSWFKKNVYN